MLSPSATNSQGNDVTVIIPHHPERGHLLNRALNSIDNQMVHPRTVLIGKDVGSMGPSYVRNHLLEQTTTKWVAFLDDDDEFLPNHLQVLLKNSAEADVVFSLWKNVGGRGPKPEFAIRHDLNRLDAANYIPMTAMVRKSMIDHVGGFDLKDRHEDWGLWKRIKAEGGRFERVMAVTWLYHRNSNRIPRYL